MPLAPAREWETLSMPALQPARGTQDLLPEMARRHRRVGDTSRELAELYGFAEIATPIFEFTEVFARAIRGGGWLIEKGCSLISRRACRNCPRTAAAGSNATRCASSIRRIRATSASPPRRPILPSI